MGRENSIWKDHLTEKLNPRDLNTLDKIDFYESKLGAVILPCRTVGVQGDGRTYSLCAGISVENARKNKKIFEMSFWENIYTLVKIIPAVLRSMNRVLFIFGDERPDQSKITNTETHLDPDSISQLQKADHICTQVL